MGDQQDSTAFVTDGGKSGAQPQCKILDLLANLHSGSPSPSALGHDPKTTMIVKSS